ncbi:MAG: pitrilysin family protein [Alphaproteobacteria bacterium]
MKKLYLIALFILSCLPSTAGVFNPQTMTLANGLQVIVIPNPIGPVVSIGMIYKVGTADDPLNMVGISHFLEHMMFRGTKTVSATEFNHLLLGKGARFNAHTTYDSTVYTIKIASAYLDLALKLEADRMQNLDFNDKLVAAEQAIVMEERLMRLDNNPFGQAYEATLHSLYWYHPYMTPPIGYPHHIRAYTRQALEEHYQKWYGPNNAVLVISGDVTLEQVKPLVEKYFKDIAVRPAPQRLRSVEPDHQGVTMEMTLNSPRITLTDISWYFAAPNHNSPNKECYYPLLVLQQILAGNDTARFYRHLVETKRLAVSVNVDYSPGLKPQPFGLSATLAPNISPQIMRKAMQEELELILKKGVTEEELANAKRDILAEFIFAQDSVNAAVAFFEPITQGFTVEELEAIPDAIKNVTREDVFKAIQVVFAKDPTLVITVFPGKVEAKIEGTIEAKKIDVGKD